VIDSGPARPRARGGTILSPAAVGAAAAAVALAVLLAGPLSLPRAEGANAPASPITIRYEGEIDLEGHYARPGDTKPFHSDQRFMTDGKGRVRLDWTIWAEGDTVREPETYLIQRDAVFHRRAPGAPWFRLSGARARLGRLEALAGLPDQLREDAARQKGALTPKMEFDGGRLKSFLVQHAHPRLGDVWDSIELTYDADDLVPVGLTMKAFERDHNWTLSCRRTEVDAGAVDEALVTAPSRADREQGPEDTGSGETRLVEFAPGVVAAEREAIDSRTLIVEFSDYLVVIEWAAGSPNGEKIVEAARRRWPQKPIRYAFFSHHHPHYVGGIRAAIAAGAVVVTTPGNADVVRRAAHATFRLEPDRLAKHPVDAGIRTFTERFELRDSTNNLVALDYGPRSGHTDEFLIFWLPRQKLLFEAELGWVGSGSSLRAGRRASDLLSYLSNNRLDVETIVQSWPMRGTEAALTRSRLEELVWGRAR
jgi:glyoxylase-like metal-dependent hydrolase (beta-lactamase superfamily II)